MIAADDPYRAGVFEYPAAFAQPGASEGIVGCETVELIPIIVHAVHQGFVGPPEFLL